ncbi:MAG: hypothetical protein K1X67_12800, partial [Fimbriimonadaceae bacterium]|nr:hypothetical protein [Fimbriimonadaceae bacterium]
LLLSHAETFAKDIQLMIWRLDEPPIPAMDPVQLISRQSGSATRNGAAEDTATLPTPAPIEGTK